VTATHSRLCVIRQSFTPSMQSPTGTYRPQPGYSLERRPNGVPYDPESENKEGLIATSNPERGARRFSLLALRSRAEWSGIRCDRISATHGEGLVEVTAQRSTLDGPKIRGAWWRQFNRAVGEYRGSSALALPARRAWEGRPFPLSTTPRARSHHPDIRT